MTKRFTLFCLGILLASFIVASSLHRKEAALSEAALSTAPLVSTAAHNPETPEASLLQKSLRRSGSQAADEKKMTTRAVAETSERAVLARCRSVEVKEVAGGNIFTFYEFDVLQELKGGSGKRSFTLRLLGGRVGNAEVTPALDVKFVPDKKYVLFLGRENKEGRPTIASQSIFQVMISPLDKREVIVPSPTGLKLYDAKNGRKYSETPELLSLEDFLFSVRKLNK